MHLFSHIDPAGKTSKFVCLSLLYKIHGHHEESILLFPSVSASKAHQRKDVNCPILPVSSRFHSLAFGRDTEQRSVSENDQYLLFINRLRESLNRRCTFFFRSVKLMARVRAWVVSSHWCSLRLTVSHFVTEPLLCTFCFDMFIIRLFVHHNTKQFLSNIFPIYLLSPNLNFSHHPAHHDPIHHPRRYVGIAARDWTNDGRFYRFHSHLSWSYVGIDFVLPTHADIGFRIFKAQYLINRFQNIVPNPGAIMGQVTGAANGLINPVFYNKIILNI